MLNKEKYIDKIAELAAEGGLALKNGRIVKCGELSCGECDAYRVEDGNCFKRLLEWANSEYVEAEQ